jgi:opacity protein-like surface antigen
LIFVSLVMSRRPFWYDAAMRRLCLLPPVACLLLLVTAAPASADLTAFLGRTTTPSTRTVKGLAIGTGLLIVGFEFEFAATDEDLDVPAGVSNTAPALKTFMFNGLLQTPVPIARMQFYGTAGGGVYRETLSTQPGDDATNLGTNIGGGVKISLAGPLRVRLDYRVFSFRGTPRHTNAQRLYAGINLKF